MPTAQSVAVAESLAAGQLSFRVCWDESPGQTNPPAPDSLADLKAGHHHNLVFRQDGTVQIYLLVTWWHKF
jgi:hypothetical protein